MIIIILDLIVAVFAMIGLYTVLALLKEQWFPKQEEYHPLPLTFNNLESDGEFIFTRIFKVKHVHDVAKQMNVTLTHGEVMRVVNVVKKDFDFTIGISASEVRSAIRYIIRDDKEN